MFESGRYRIRFFKFYGLAISSKNKGRYGTICRIENTKAEFVSEGTAYLHPKDSPNKITGKKIALTKALSNMSLNIPPLCKVGRTIIWKAFWNWIESWKTNNNPTCFGEPTQESEKCNNCFCLNQCVNKLWRETPPDSST